MSKVNIIDLSYIPWSEEFLKTATKVSQALKFDKGHIYSIRSALNRFCMEAHPDEIFDAQAFRRHLEIIRDRIQDKLRQENSPTLKVMKAYTQWSKLNAMFGHIDAALETIAQPPIAKTIKMESGETFDADPDDFIHLEGNKCWINLGQNRAMTITLPSLPLKECEMAKALMAFVRVIRKTGEK